MGAIPGPPSTSDVHGILMLILSMASLAILAAALFLLLRHHYRASRDRFGAIRLSSRPSSPVGRGGEDSREDEGLFGSRNVAVMLDLEGMERELQDVHAWRGRSPSFSERDDDVRVVTKGLSTQQPNGGMLDPWAQDARDCLDDRGDSSGDEGDRLVSNPYAPTSKRLQ